MNSDGAPQICFFCRKTVEAGLVACPHCGTHVSDALKDGTYSGDHKLTSEELRAHYKHPQIVAAVLTFCFGLLLVHFISYISGPGRFRSRADGFNPLVALEILMVSCTCIYLVLRQTEGDFRALFLVAMLLFVSEECVTYFMKAYWLNVFRELDLILTFACCIFAVLALIAGVYDPPTDDLARNDIRDPYKKPLIGSCLAVMMICGSRAVVNVPKQNWDSIQHRLSIIIIVGICVYLLAKLLGARKTDGSGSVNRVEAVEQQQASPNRVSIIDSPPASPGIPPGAPVKGMTPDAGD